jgi:hypothetical protein
MKRGTRCFDRSFVGGSIDGKWTKHDAALVHARHLEDPVRFWVLFVKTGSRTRKLGPSSPRMLDSAGFLNNIFIALGFRRNGLARAKPKNCKPKSEEVHITLYSSTRFCDRCCEEARGESAGAREEVGERECQRGNERHSRERQSV